MPQLSAPASGMIAVGDARQLAVSCVTPLSRRRTLPLNAGLNGRVPVETCYARCDIPGFINSAVDGYAARYSDYMKARPLKIAGTCFAGDVPESELAGDSCLRVMTGAFLPANADVVVMTEDSRKAGENRIRLRPGLKRYSNIRPAHDVIERNSPICPAGNPLTAARLGLLTAAYDRPITVYERCRIAVLATGSELAATTAMKVAGQIVDTNSIMLQALLRDYDFDRPACFRSIDDETALSKKLKQLCGRFDFVFTTGGISTGEKDLMLPVIARMGQIHFRKAAIKPGRPVTFATINDTPILCLPGNPVAAFLGCCLFGLPALRRRSGHTAALAGQWPFALPVTAGFDYQKKTGRTEYLRCILDHSVPGQPVAQRVGRPGAAVLSSLAASTGMVALEASCAAVSSGTKVGYIPHNAW